MNIKSTFSQLKNGHNKLVFAGPCSIESEIQIQDIANQLSEIPEVGVIRGGIWKARTRPNSFEGMGKEALPWLKNAGNEVNLPVAVEVANSKHVELCLKENIDILWLGSRTVVNPFSVQEIAESLRGVDIPVLIKNPMNPDLNLWIGAFERFLNLGINNLMGIHRGFSSINSSSYRNVPHWSIPLELKRQFPMLPIISDPSHIAGIANKVELLSQNAMYHNLDGLMIETHNCPEKALSDAKQQITPSHLKSILTNLNYSNPNNGEIDLELKIADVSSYIDDIDSTMEFFEAKKTLLEKGRTILIQRFENENPNQFSKKANEGETVRDQLKEDFEQLLKGKTKNQIQHLNTIFSRMDI